MINQNFQENKDFWVNATILHILTPSIRPQLLSHALNSIAYSEPHDLNVQWHIFFRGKEIDNHGCYQGNHFKNSLTGDLKKQWVFGLCDDNGLHPSFLRRIGEEIKKNPSMKMFVFWQERHDTPFHLMPAKDKMIRPGMIDNSQVVIRADALDGVEANLNELSDGEYFKKIYEMNKESTLFLNEVLAYFESAFWYIGGGEKRQRYILEDATCVECRFNEMKNESLKLKWDTSPKE